MRFKLRVEADGLLEARGIITRRGHKQPQKPKKGVKVDLTTKEGAAAAVAQIRELLESVIVED